MIREYSDEANELLEGFCVSLKVMEDFFCLTYKAPVHDVARRLMNEVVGFEPVGEDKKSIVPPCETG